MTIVIDTDELGSRRIEAHLYKLVNVLRVENITLSAAVFRDLAMIKVAATAESRTHIMQLVDVFRARVVDVAMVRRAAREVKAGSPPRPWRRYAALAALAAAAAFAVVGLRPGRSDAPPLAAASAGAVTAPAPHPAAEAPSPLAPMLLGLDRDRSFRAAVGQVQALWGPDPLEQTPLRTHMEQVRRLNLPVVLEMFHPARRETCYLALLRVDGDRAIVAGEGAPLRVPLADVDRLWTRQAVFLWRDFDALAPGGDPTRTNAWVRQTLARLGYAPQEPDLAGAVARFQQDADLAADGVVGARTLMTLYSRSHYPRPRLSGGAS